MSKKRKPRTRIWFNSTAKVLLAVFLFFVVVGIWRFGWREVLDSSLFYIIGCTFTALVIYTITQFRRKK